MPLSEIHICLGVVHLQVGGYTGLAHKKVMNLLFAKS